MAATRPPWLPPITSALPEVAWPAVATPVGASLLALLYQLEQSQWLDDDALRQAQARQLDLLLTHCRTAVPYYRQTLANLAGPMDWAAWHRLPVLERSEVQQHGEALRSSKLPTQHGATIPFSTSGSLGMPIAGVETELSHFFWNALTLRNHLWHRRNFDGRFAAIRTRVKDAHLADWGDPVARLFRSGPAGTLDIATDIDTQIAWLRQFQPDYLLTHPSNLRALALRLRHSGQHLPLSQALTFGEALPSGLAELCQQVFGSPVADIYSCEEAGYLALQCPDQPGYYHVMAENVLLEVLDDASRPCQAGETGRVVITPLHNFAMPLLRYAIGDYAEVGPPCPCGRGLPVLTRIHGRMRNMMLLPDGSRHWPSFPADTWQSIADIRQIQLIQRHPEWIEVHYMSPEPLLADQRQALIAAIRQSLRFPFRITVRRVAATRAAGPGKYEDFICEAESCP